MKQLLKFAMVGVLNTTLGYAVIFACMYVLGIDAVVSNVIGYAFGLVEIGRASCRERVL